MAAVTFAQANPAHAAQLPYAQLSAQLGEAARAQSSGEAYAHPATNPSLSVVQQLQSSLATYRQVQQNGIGASSLLEIAAQGLDTIRDLLGTLHGLAQQASDANITTQQRGYLQAAFTQGLSAIDSVAQNTSFDGKQLLDGNASAHDGGAAIPIILGPLPNGVLQADIRDVSTARLFTSTPDLGTAAHAASAVSAIAAAQALFEPVAGAVAGYQASVTSASQTAGAVIGGDNAAVSHLSGTNAIDVRQLLALLNNQQQTTLATLAQTRSLSSGLLNLLNGELKRELLLN